jgi:hypothetical protein
LDVLYDGINGALPNLDLLNTAVNIAHGQMGIDCTLHGMEDHADKYKDRLECIGRGIVSQAAGHATGPHSAFMPYHVDAITLRTIGDGWHDEISLGRVTESVFRSINNLLEHLHQSFFFYILMSKLRFVSIGSYLPAAMIIAGSFTINALALWVLSGRGPVEAPGKTTPSTSEKLKEKVAVSVGGGKDAVVVVVPKAELESVERKLALPAIVVLAVHLLSFVPLYLLTSLHQKVGRHLVSWQNPNPCVEGYPSPLLTLHLASSLDLPPPHHDNLSPPTPHQRRPRARIQCDIAATPSCPILLPAFPRRRPLHLGDHQFLLSASDRPPRLAIVLCPALHHQLKEAIREEGKRGHHISTSADRECFFDGDLFADFASLVTICAFMGLGEGSKCDPAGGG